jgi:hypothetical protein
MSNLVWCHKQGSFPLADFDEYEEVAKLEALDRNDYIRLRMTGFDHSDAFLALQERELYSSEANLVSV